MYASKFTRITNAFLQKPLQKLFSFSSMSGRICVCVCVCVHLYLSTRPVSLMFPVGSVLRSSGPLQGVSEWLLLTPGLLLTKALCFSLPRPTVSALSDLSFYWLETRRQLELRLAHGERVNMPQLKWDQDITVAIIFNMRTGNVMTLWLRTHTG